MGTTHVAQPPADVVEEPLILEPRWPPVASLLMFMGLTIGLRHWLPQERLVGGPWAAPAIELLLLMVLLTADPGTRTTRTKWLRPTSIALVASSSSWRSGLLRCLSTT